MVAVLGSVSPEQVWSILSRHARDEISPLRLQELCRDNDRVSALVAVYNREQQQSDNNTNNDRCNSTIIIDLSRQRMTDTTLNHLLHLAATMNVKQYIKQLAWGQNDYKHPVQPAVIEKKDSSIKMPMFDKNKLTRFRSEISAAVATQLQPKIPSSHLSLRVPANAGHTMLDLTGNNILINIHREWNRIQRLSDSIRLGKLRGATGQMIKDVIIVGKGVAVNALQFIYNALLHDEEASLATKFGLSVSMDAASRLRMFAVTSGSNTTSIHNNKVHGRTMKFITTVDPVQIAHTINDNYLDPATTLVISIAVAGNEETGLTTKILKNWLLTLRKDNVLAKHMILITGNERIASVIHKPESVFLLHDHTRCEPFLSTSAIVLVPLSIVFGWSIAHKYLSGAHDMDKHFVETNPRHNLPVLLALSDIWNDTCLRATARIVNPFTQAFAHFPSFLGSIESQTCGRSSQVEHNNIERQSCSSLVLDGSDGAMDRAVYQSDIVVNSEIVMALDCQIKYNAGRSCSNEDIHAAQDALICSMFAHADELAFGNVSSANESLYLQKNMNVSEGNRPSTLIMCGRLDAFACGQLIALSEHRAFVKSYIYEIDPFVHDVGSSLRMERVDEMKNEFVKMFTLVEREDQETSETEESLNLATKTLLKHYATMMKNERVYTVHEGDNS